MLLLKIFLFALLLIIGILLGYALITLIGIIVPSNKKFKPAENGITIYISTNGLHTDFILPCVNDFFDWTKWVSNQDYSSDLSKDHYLSFGWGDRAIYLDLDSWDNLTVALTLKTLLWPTPTLMRLTAHEDLPQNKKMIHQTSITQEQYIKLCQYIFDTFTLDSGKKEIRIEGVEGVSFTANDNFYQANGKYHAFNTCNNWVNRGLRQIGVRTALWSPLYN